MKEKHTNVTGEVLDGPRAGEMSEIISASNSDLNQNQKGMVLPFSPLSVAFDNMRYSVDMPAVNVLPWYILYLTQTQAIFFYQFS